MSAAVPVLGIIGLGSRATLYATLALRAQETGKARLAAVCDIDPARLAAFSDDYFGKMADPPRRFADHRGITSDPTITHVIVCTPDDQHLAPALDAIRSGKDLLLEKPIEANPEAARAIYEAGRDHPRKIMMGFVLRYSPIYRKIFELTRADAFGPVVCMEADETLGADHAASFYRRWHRHTARSGGFLNTKCSHDLDILSWLAGADPERIASFGALSHFIPKPGAAASCGPCALKADCAYVFRPEKFPKFNPVEDICPFGSDKGIVDHQSVAMGFPGGCTATFTLSAISAVANRTLKVFGGRQTLFADIERGVIELRTIHPAGLERIDIGAAGGHAGGDGRLFDDFLSADVRVNEIRDGYMASMAAFAADRSMRENRTVRLDEGEV